MADATSASSASASKAMGLNLHPIKLHFAHISKVAFEAREIPENLSEADRAKAIPGFFRFSVRSNLEDGHATVVSTVLCLFRDDQQAGAAEAQDSKDCYALEVSVTSGFVFDPQEISKGQVQEWCQKGSIFVVLPFIRSVIANLTRESGFPLLLLPLLEVPTFRPPPAAKELPAQERPAQEG